MLYVDYISIRNKTLDLGAGSPTPADALSPAPQKGLQVLPSVCTTRGAERSALLLCLSSSAAVNFLSLWTPPAPIFDLDFPMYEFPDALVSSKMAFAFPPVASG